jgi:hypothetical protein
MKETTKRVAKKKPPAAMAVMNAIVNANEVAEDAPDSEVLPWWQQVKSKCRRVVNRHHRSRRGKENSKQIPTLSFIHKRAGWQDIQKRREPYTVMVAIIVRCTSSRQVMRLLTRNILISSRRKEI